MVVGVEFSTLYRHQASNMATNDCESLSMEKSVANRLNRIRVNTQIFTPSKVQATTKNYIINERRAAQKLIDATNRENDIEIKMKGGNLIMQLTPATFLHFNEKVLQYYNQHEALKAIVHERYDQSKKLVERSLSVKEKDNPRLQLYRINIFHTTQSLEINGRQVQLFLAELKQILLTLEGVKGMAKLNAIIRAKCTEFLDSNTTRGEITSTSNQIAKTSDNQDAKCPKCKKRCCTKSAYCNLGQHWVHYKCERLTDSQIKMIETDGEKIPYSCSICVSNTSKDCDQVVAEPAINKTIPEITLTEDIAQDVHKIVDIDRGHTQHERSALTTLSSALTRIPAIESPGNLNRILSTGTSTYNQQQTQDAELTEPKISDSNEVKNKELRQRELKLKKREDDLKKQKAEFDDRSKDIGMLQRFN